MTALLSLKFFGSGLIITRLHFVKGYKIGKSYKHYMVNREYIIGILTATVHVLVIPATHLTGREHKVIMNCYGRPALGLGMALKKLVSITQVKCCYLTRRILMAKRNKEHMVFYYVHTDMHIHSSKA